MKYEPEEMMGGRGEANCAIVHQHDVMAGSECLRNLWLALLQVWQQDTKDLVFRVRPRIGSNNYWSTDNMKNRVQRQRQVPEFQAQQDQTILLS